MVGTSRILLSFAFKTIYFAPFGRREIVKNKRDL